MDGIVLAGFFGELKERGGEERGARGEGRGARGEGASEAMDAEGAVYIEITWAEGRATTGWYPHRQSFRW
jgi:hypothetical protein